MMKVQVFPRKHTTQLENLSILLILRNLPQAHLLSLLPKYRSNNLFVLLWDKLIRWRRATLESLLMCVSHFESLLVSEHSWRLNNLSEKFQSSQKIVFKQSNVLRWISTVFHRQWNHSLQVSAILFSSLKSQAWSCYDNNCQQKSKRQDKNQMRLKSYILKWLFCSKRVFEIYFANAKNQDEAG